MKTKQINISTMRVLSIALVIALGLSACGGGQPEGTIGELYAQRDSLRTARTNIADALRAVEDQIAALDTNTMIRTTTITTMKVEPEVFEHFFTIQGVVETDQNAQIFPEVGGKIVAIKVEEGDKVSAGQVLMQIDNRIVKNQIDELKSRLSLAETVFKKQEHLWEQEVGSEIQYLEAKNNYESLKQNLETLEAQNALYTITAPFSGIVDEIMPKEGEMAAPQMPAMRLINTSNMYIKSDVTERYLGQIKEKDSVEVNFPSLGEKQVTTIDRIGSFINPNNRTFKIRLNVDNSHNTLKPNLLGELKIRDYMNDSTIVIPSSLVQMTPSGEEFVYTVTNDQAKKVYIETGMTYNDEVEVLKGLNGNDLLINKGARSIKDGDPVQIEE